MDGNCHFVFGASVGTAISLNLDLISAGLPNISNSAETATLFILGGIIGGIFPDIDNPVSHMGKLSIPISSMIGEISKLFGKTGKNHRGVLHDPIVYIIGIVLSYMYFSPLVGFFVGCFSHVYLDMFNPSGVPILFEQSKIRLAKISSGSKESIIFTWINVIAVIAISIFIKSYI